MQQAERHRRVVYDAWRRSRPERTGAGFAVVELCSPAIDLSVPSAAILGGVSTLIAWIAQKFLRLVLLSVIMVGQKVMAAGADKQALQTYKDAEALLSGKLRSNARWSFEAEGVLTIN